MWPALLAWLALVLLALVAPGPASLFARARWFAPEQALVLWCAPLLQVVSSAPPIVFQCALFDCRRTQPPALQPPLQLTFGTLS